ncbi:MAG: sugar phosphate isomerase/epimerase, partial [Chitinophagaceae bacterium]
MTTRRSFIKTSAALSVGAFVAPSILNYKDSLIGLQLYTVRDAMQKDPAGTLAKVAAIGYNSVENATYTGTQNFYGMDAKAYAKLLKDNGLKNFSGHYRWGLDEKGGVMKGSMLHEWDKAVDDAAAVGLKYMICAWLSPDERGNADHYKKLAAACNAAGETCKKAGIQFCYHNHDFEFEKEDGKYKLDTLLAEADKDLVKMELDLYWVNKAGADPIQLFEQHPGRFPLWHVKDMDNTPNHAFTEVGNGVIDFK